MIEQVFDTLTARAGVVRRSPRRRPRPRRPRGTGGRSAPRSAAGAGGSDRGRSRSRSGGPPRPTPRHARRPAPRSVRRGPGAASRSGGWRSPARRRPGRRTPRPGPWPPPRGRPRWRPRLRASSIRSARRETRVGDGDATSCQVEHGLQDHPLAAAPPPVEGRPVHARALRDPLHREPRVADLGELREGGRDDGRADPLARTAAAGAVGPLALGVHTAIQANATVRCNYFEDRPTVTR